MVPVMMQLRSGVTPHVMRGPSLSPGFRVTPGVPGMTGMVFWVIVSGGYGCHYILMNR